jgi:glycosyltransferase involved in cell wall biosynthesis
MRICFLADAGSVNTQTWADHFADRLGHEVHVVSVNRAGEFSPSVRLRTLGSHSERLGALGKLAYVTRIGAIRRIVAEIDPDLVIGYRVASYGYIGARVGFHPLVVVAQGQNIVVPWRSRPKRASARAAIRAADLIHTWAPHMTRRLIELGADPSKIMVCPRGIDLDRFVARAAGEPPALTAVSTRSLTRGYRAETVVRSFILAAAELPEFSGALVGNGAEMSALSGLVSEAGLSDRIRFEGRVPNDRVPGLLGRSAVYVSAVRTDGVSASLLEAMARGCFPVVRDNDANRHWVTHGENGFLIEGDDPSDYAAAIVSARRDDALRERAAVANRVIVEERADLAKNARRIEAAYRELVESFGGGRRRR